MDDHSGKITNQSTGIDKDSSLGTEAKKKKNSFKCPECNNCFSTKQSAQRHLKTIHHGEYMFFYLIFFFTYN